MKKISLSNNQLKLIAMVTMTVDHIGAYLFPQVLWLRLVGRLAFPIYAYMIAEGCRHTRSMGRYLASLAVMAAVCQGAYFIAMDSLYMCILVTFSMSVGLIWLQQFAEKQQTLPARILAFTGFILAFFLCELLPKLLPGTDYRVDYGFLGVLVPVVIFSAKDKPARLICCGVSLACLSLFSNRFQWWSLLALIPLALYSGQRGKRNMKWFFYLFYPAHLLVIHGISLFL